MKKEEEKKFIVTVRFGDYIRLARKLEGNWCFISLPFTWWIIAENQWKEVDEGLLGAIVACRKDWLR